MRTAAVYRITNTVNGHAYIGVSIEPHKRVISHLGASSFESRRIRPSKLVRQAVAKYGLGVMDFEVLLWGEEQYCYDMELILIKGFNTQVPNGYNIEKGGNRPRKKSINATARKGRTLEELYGAEKAAQIRARTSASQKGISKGPSPLRGRTGTPHTEEFKEYARSLRIGKTHAEIFGVEKSADMLKRASDTMRKRSKHQSTLPPLP